MFLWLAGSTKVSVCNSTYHMDFVLYDVNILFD